MENSGLARRGWIRAIVLLCGIAGAGLWPGTSIAQSVAGASTVESSASKGAGATGANTPVFYVVTSRVTITTDDGVTTLNAGTKVKLVQDKGATLLVNDGDQNLEISKSYLADASEAGAVQTSPVQAPGAAAAKSKPAADEFTVNYLYGNALESTVGADFDRAARECEEAYRVNPTGAGVNQLRSMIALMRVREQQLKEGGPAAQQQYQAAFNEVEAFARPERVRVLAIVQDLRAKAADATRQETVDEEKQESEQTTREVWFGSRLLGVGVVVVVILFLRWVVKRQIY